VRVDPRSGHVLVGFGTSQIVTIDPAKPRSRIRPPIFGGARHFRNWCSDSSIST
jgi:hypothetical protein